MKTSWLFDKRLASAKVRIAIVILFVGFFVSACIGWGIIFFRGDKPITNTKNILSDDPLVEQVTKLKQINDILYENIKETDEWVARRDQLIRSLSEQLPTEIVVDEVVQLAESSGNEEKARIFLGDLERVFRVEKNSLTLTSDEVKIKRIGDKIYQKEVKIIVK